MLEVSETPAGWIEAIQPSAGRAEAAGADPEAARGVFIDGAHKIAGDALWDCRIMAIAGELPRGAVEQGQPTAHGADPQAACAVLQYRGHDTVADGCGIVRVWLVAGDLPGARVEPVEPVAPGADPDDPIAILVEGHNRTGTQAVGILWVSFEDGELIAIVAVQAILGAKPKETLLVLQDSQHGVL